jgi:hypothetical protein
MGRRYSRKDTPVSSDLPLLWDSENADWRLSTLSDIKDFVLSVPVYPWTVVTSLLNGWTGEVRIKQLSNWIIVTGEVDGSAKTGNSIYTLPTAFFPKYKVQCTAWDENGAVNTFVQDSGSVVSEGTGAAQTFTVTFPVEE